MKVNRLWANNLTYPEKRSIEFKTNNGQLQVF